MKILLIEDDIEIREMLKNFLMTEDFEVMEAADGQQAWQAFEENGDFSIVLLDLMIPKISGMQILQMIRKTSTVPIIIMSAKDTDSDITLGLGLGADDYITKPFSVTEVLARIKANIRRTTQYTTIPDKEEIVTVGDLSMNVTQYSVTKNGAKVELTAKEFEILKLLFCNPQKVYTKEQLYSLVWKDSYFGDENAVNVHISRLRNKIEDNPREPQYVITVWGIGYRLGEME